MNKYSLKALKLLKRRGQLTYGDFSGVWDCSVPATENEYLSMLLHDRYVIRSDEQPLFYHPEKPAPSPVFEITQKGRDFLSSRRDNTLKWGVPLAVTFIGIIVNVIITLVKA